MGLQFRQGNRIRANREGEAPAEPRFLNAHWLGRSLGLPNVIALTIQARHGKNICSGGRAVVNYLTVDQAVPLIYSREPRSNVLPAQVRLIAFIVAASCLVPLLLAVRLTPSSDGLATHTELGLQPCRWLQVTGFPCPSCGMTTSWAWFVRANIAASLYVQPMGTVLALIAVACVWVGFYVVLTGRPVYRLLVILPGRYYFIALLAFGILAWAWKIYIHLAGKDGWT